MVSNGIESTVLKAKCGTDIRKSQLHHTQDLNFNDLVLMMQRIFHIKSSTSIALKYRDGEGDWITLANDDDVVFALQNEPSLYLEVFTDQERASRPLSPITTTESVVTSHSSVKEDSMEQKRQPVDTPQQNQLEEHKQEPTPNNYTQPDNNHYQHTQHEPATPPAQNFQGFQQPSQHDLPPSNQIPPQQHIYGGVASSPQRPPSSIHSASGGGQFGACPTPPVAQSDQQTFYPYQAAPPSQQPQYNSDYSAPPTIHPSVHKEVVVSAAYGTGFQQPQMTAPPMGQYGTATPPVSQYNQPPMGQHPQQPPPSAGPPYSGYQPNNNGSSNFSAPPQQIPQGMAPPPNSQPMQQPGFGPPPVSSIVGNAATGGNPFSRGPGQPGFGRPTNAQGNY